MEGSCDPKSAEGFSISDGCSKIQEKINVVQEVLTLLEETMSSAKSTHHKNQASYQSRIDELELQIQNLRRELHRDRDDFSGISESLEDGIQKYLNLENKLLTIEELSHDDYVVLPDLPSNTDIYVAQYLTTKYNKWQQLKLQCHVLNQSTQNHYRDSISSKRYRVSVCSDPEADQRYSVTLEKANALNTFRGKKHVSENPIPPCRFVSLTWYKDEVAARYYAQMNHRQIIEQVFKQQYEEYNGRSIEISELPESNAVDLRLLATELTIHVQAKTSTTLNINVPRRITLYQFDDTATSIPPALTTYDIQTAPNLPPGVDNEEPGPSSKTPETSSKSGRHEKHHERVNEFPPNQKSPSKSRTLKATPLKKATSEAIDVLSLIGLDDNRTSIAHDRNSPFPQISTSEQLGLTSMTDNMRLTENEVDIGEDGPGIWASVYVQKKEFKELTSVQKSLLKCFKIPGDIVYGGVANAGKTTGMVIGVLNNVDKDRKCVQALIVTPNARSSKLIQNEIELINTGEQPGSLCQRADQILGEQKSQDKRDSSHAFTKTSNQPFIVVGTLNEMNRLVLKSLPNKDEIRFLVLHKADEIFGTEASKKIDHAMLVNQILYALNATIKVIVVHRTSVSCPKLDSFCKFKLRQKQTLLESVDVSALHASVPSEDKSPVLEKPDLVASSEGTNQSNRVSQQRMSTSTDDENAESLMSPGTTDESLEESDTPTEDEDDDWDQEEINSEFRTIITKTGMELLGVSLQTSDDKNNKKMPQPEYVRKITHLYAHIDEGDDLNKISMLSMLDLETDKTIIFCNSKEKAEWVSTKLRQKRMWPQVLHEDVTPKDRVVILRNYRQGTLCRVLICTDFLSSVSLDSADIVINFDLPKSNSIYRTRAAFVTRHLGITSTKNNVTAVVVNLTVCSADVAATRAFEVGLKIVINNCDGPD